MDKELLKKMACEAIDQEAKKIHDFTLDVYHNPELGFKEFETTKKTADFLREIGLEVEENIAITGCRANTGAKEGQPNLCIMGELDSVVCADHKDAGKDGASHSCGHHVQLGAMLGSAIGLVASGVMEHLDGSVEFMAVPAEEFIEIDYRSKLIAEGKIKYAGGKQELIARGYFDKIDISMMMHTSNHTPPLKAVLGTSSNGFIGKKANFIGREAHSGGAPHLGINALNAASLALNNINAQRETFKDEDHIRVHPIITKGGDIVNVVPSDVRLETYVRGSTIEGMQAANKKVNRSLKAGAMAVGGKVEIQEIPGYLPLKPDQKVDSLFKENLLAFIKEEEIKMSGTMTGSTDFGDITHIMPGIHPMIGGVSGAAHTREFSVDDVNLAYIIPAKAFAMTAIDLLYDGAKGAKEISKNFKPSMTRQEYLAFLEESSSKKTFSFEEE
ncbi:MAG TPA: amidohydrolase [Clostridia bacterium]|nr:amidohydrolase [Clostridia bacterium]